MSSSTEAKAQKTWNEWLPPILMAAAIISAAIGIAFTIYHLNITPNDALTYDVRGPIGDFWGGHISSTANLVAAFLFAAALFYQREDLRLTRETLAQQIRELKETRIATEAEVEAFKKQNRIHEDQAEMTFLLQYLEHVKECERDIVYRGRGSVIDRVGWGIVSDMIRSRGRDSTAPTLIKAALQGSDYRCDREVSRFLRSANFICEWARRNNPGLVQRRFEIIATMLPSTFIQDLKGHPLLVAEGFSNSSGLAIYLESDGGANPPR